MPETSIKLTMNIDRPLRDSFKAATAARGTTMTEVLMEFIHDYVKKHGVQPKKGRRG
jgi:hypothetical protein